MTEIDQIILISGKRKCGKDYVAGKLQSRLDNDCQIVRISEPLKKKWSKKQNLNLEKLLGDSPYKEKYRKEMIAWGEETRDKDYGVFCRAAMENVNTKIVIVSDIRRKNDLKYFRDNYGDRVKTLRLICPELIRAERGWIHTVGVDDATSECDLDDYEQWDLIVENDNQLNGEQLVDLVLAKFNL